MQSYDCFLEMRAQGAGAAAAMKPAVEHNGYLKEPGYRGVRKRPWGPEFGSELSIRRRGPSVEPKQKQISSHNIPSFRPRLHPVGDFQEQEVNPQRPTRVVRWSHLRFSC
ncbi:hypothetical protein V6N13_147635 [Hibiscus sabdariffa]|uniref:Uncharacterized protein n=1 Tax=Hibiscus sabdariffa TaxID=183260 RepID=A0ABR2TWY6_9ROSI